MVCAKGDWTVRFPEVNGLGGSFEIRANTINLKRDRSELAYARAQFPSEVGDMMMPEPRNSGGALREPTPVEILKGGELVYSLWFKPDYARYTSSYTYIEFHDLQKSLDSGVVDRSWESVKLKEAYEYAFSKRTNELIKDIYFTVPDTEIFGTSTFISDLYEDASSLFNPLANPTQDVESADDLEPFRISQLNGVRQGFYRFFNQGQVNSIESDKTASMVDSYFAVNFDKISPLEAIWKLNKKFQTTTWIDRDRNLWVGWPSRFAQTHIAAPDDQRVWRVNPDNVSISHSREPIRRVTVEGSWVDDPTQWNPENFTSWLTHGNNPEGYGQVRATGFAEREEIDSGTTFVVKSTSAKKDALPGIAKSILHEKMKEQNRGSVQINTQLSGNHTSLIESKPGDILHLVPTDNTRECKSVIDNDRYLIEDVQHSFEDGLWSLDLGIAMYPDTTSSGLRYFDPDSEEYLTEEQAFGPVHNV